MTKTITDAATLKLTVDNKGVVWYLRGQELPHSSELVDFEFIKSPILRESEQVRMFGTESNAALLNSLYELKLKNEIDSLQVGSPACCEVLEDNDPELVLIKMRDYNLAPSLGGWHTFGLRDFPCYALAAHFKDRTDTCEYTRQVVYAHPAWPALAFIGGIDIDAISRLLALIIDPRWFVDAYDISSDVKLEQFLGISPHNMSGTALLEKDIKVERCKLVLDCWKTATACLSVLPSTPRNFLWRSWSVKKGGIAGDMYASRRFISYLRSTWTKAMCIGPQADHLFVAKYFFSNEDEYQAYIEHERTFKSPSKLGDLT